MNQVISEGVEFAKAANQNLMSVVATLKNGKRMRYSFFMPDGVTEADALADFQNAATLREAAGKYKADVQIA